MKPVTLLCVVSVVLNVAGGIYVATRLSATQAGGGAGGARTMDGREVKTGLSEETKRLLAGTGTGDLAVLRDRLRAEGLPESIVRDVVSGRLWTERQAKLDAADPIKKRPWWQQTREQLPGDDVRMTRLEERLRIDYRVRMDGLFPGYSEEGERADPAAAFLPEAKQQALQKLRRDYAELNSRLEAESGGVYIGRNDGDKQVYLKEEEEKDLRALLTPEEYAERTLRGVEENPQLKKMAAIVGLSEHEFRGMLAINEWLDKERGKNGRYDPFAPPSPEQDALTAEGKRKRLELIGPEKAGHFYEVNDEDYAIVARAVARYDLPLSRVDEYFTLWKAVMQPGDELDLNIKPGEEPSAQEIQLFTQRIEVPLTKILGPEGVSTGTSLGQMIEWVHKHSP